MNELEPTPDAQWDALVLSLPRPHVLQSAAWGAFKARWGWSCARLVWGDADRPRAAAQILVRDVGRLLRFAYIPRGPMLARPDSEEDWLEVLADIATWARRERLAEVKMDPGVSCELRVVAAAWRRLGWRPVAREVQFPNTMVSDLTVGEEGLLEAMKSKTRYNVRLAARRGVEVRRGALDDLATFFDLYRATGERGGFATRTWPYYRDAWTSLLATGHAALLLAEHEGQALAGSLPVAYGKTAWFLYGASGDVGREHMPSYLVQWESLRWAMAEGCRAYDWWGGPTRLDAGDSMWGVYQFKLGFGARLVEQFGAFEKPTSPVRYGILRIAERARNVWLRARSGGAGRGGGSAAAL